MESIFKRNGTLANVINSIDTPEGVAGRDTPVGRMVLPFVVKGLYGLFDRIKSFFSEGGDG